MNQLKKSLFYLVMIGGFSALMYRIMVMGTGLEDGRIIHVPVGSRESQWRQFLQALSHNLEHPLAMLLAQIVTIILVARIFGWLCRKIGQPAVIGEIAAGIALGPSLVGMYFPEFSHALFPPASLGNLQFLSQIGLILFMFVIGMEIDLTILRNKAKDAVVISHASIVVPFALGMGMAYFIYTSFAPEGVPFSSFGLFMGIAMSITAFPVLARIVQERGLHRSHLGTIVITCAAADDITAWCLLAAVIAIVKAGSFVSAIYTLMLAVGYVVLMSKLVKPFLKRIADLYGSREKLGKPIVAIFFLTLIVSSYATEVIGIHALFGAFMAGAIMPENVKFRNIFIEKVEDIALVLLLPLFFVFTGLRTQIGLINDIHLWQITGLIVLVAVVGKFVGSALAARFVGQSWKDSLTIGALMNTRGLMELVVLNIGYDLGVLTPEVFSMLVIMALVTTLMTGPALDLINALFKGKEKPKGAGSENHNIYTVLLSFVHPERSVGLLRMANALTAKKTDPPMVTAMHLTASNELHPYTIEEYERQSFASIKEEANRLDQAVTTLFKASNNPDADLVEVANKGKYDLLLIGVEQSIFEGSFLGKLLGFTTRFINPERLIGQVTGKEGFFENSPFNEQTRWILAKSAVPVGILIDKDLTSTDEVFVLLFSEKDALLLDYVERLTRYSGSAITVLDISGIAASDPAVKEKVAAIETNTPGLLRFRQERTFDRKFIKKQNLMLVSYESWKQLIDTKSQWLSDIPSTLILADPGGAS